MRKTDWRGFWLAAAAIVLLGYFYQSDRTVAARGPAPDHQLRVVSATQSAEGVSESDLTPQFAIAMEKYSASRIFAALQSAAKQRGAVRTPPRIKSESLIVESQGKKLIVIRHEVNATARSVEILGVSGANLSRVMCARDTLDEIFLTEGPCAQAIKATHGIVLGDREHG